MNVRSCCQLRTRLRLVLQVLAFFGVMLPHGALADGEQGRVSGPGPSACAPPSPHRVQLAAGAHYMPAARNDYGESLKITPSLQAAYLYRAFRAARAFTSPSS
ncbi:MAG TPA: hypothetical protein VK550_09630 [Polyangiaceae bacterium]|nr:hypothetical protein [Polyangiaceae bacterium]